MSDFGLTKGEFSKIEGSLYSINVADLNTFFDCGCCSQQYPLPAEGAALHDSEPTLRISPWCLGLKLQGESAWKKMMPSDAGGAAAHFSVRIELELRGVLGLAVIFGVSVLDFRMPGASRENLNGKWTMTFSIRIVGYISA